MRRSLDLADRLSKSEGDEICHAVLQLVEHLVRGHKQARRLEPTGIAVAPVMRRYVERSA